MNFIDPKNDGTSYHYADIRETSCRFVVLLVALTAVALIGGFGAKPAYRWFKAQRALAMVAQGEAAASNDWTQAGRNVQTTLRPPPEESRLLRLAAPCCTETTTPAGRNYRQMVQALAGLTLDEQYHHARLAVDLRRTDLSAQVPQRLVVTNEIDPRVLRLVVTHAETVGSSGGHQRRPPPGF
jgi:hypothetical protein